MRLYSGFDVVLHLCVYNTYSHFYGSISLYKKKLENLLPNSNVHRLVLCTNDANNSISLVQRNLVWYSLHP